MMGVLDKLKEEIQKEVETRSLTLKQEMVKISALLEKINKNLEKLLKEVKKLAEQRRV